MLLSGFLDDSGESKESSMSKEYQIMKERPEQERPYELCEKLGAEALSDAQLLAVILRTGSRGETVLDLAGRILYRSGLGGLEGLYQLTLQELREIRGVGRVKAIQLKCIGELSKRIWSQRRSGARFFHDAGTIADYYMEYMRHLEQEIVILVMLDTKNAMIDDVMISKGTVSASIISPREIFIKALSSRAVKIVLLHNHPSGMPAPSTDDMELTRQVKEAGQLLHIELADHIIIGDGVFYSFREEGLL